MKMMVVMIGDGDAMIEMIVMMTIGMMMMMI